MPGSRLLRPALAALDRHVLDLWRGALTSLDGRGRDRLRAAAAGPRRPRRSWTGFGGGPGRPLPSWLGGTEYSQLTLIKALN